MSCKDCHYYGRLTGGTYGCTAFKCKKSSWTDKSNPFGAPRRAWSKFGSWLGFWY